MSKDKKNTATMPILAMLLAWLVPGAGHMYIGRWKRGIILFVVIAATFWGGVAMGGVMTVDYFNSRWWFMAEMVTGVHGVAGWYRQKLVYDKIDAQARQTGESVASMAMMPDKLDEKLIAENVALTNSPTDTIARSYAGVAGMLNVLCIVDALMLSLMGVYGESSQPPKAKDGSGAPAC